MVKVEKSFKRVQVPLMDVYPFNLALAIFKNEDEARSIYVPGLISVIDTLNDREQEVIRLRFLEKLTLDRCAELIGENGVSRERVRQVEHLAIRKLMSPARSNLFKAVSKYDFIELSEKYRDLEKQYGKLKGVVEANGVNVGEIIKLRKDLAENIPIFDLGFSTRTFHCLMRANKNTLGDIINTPDDELRSIRNLGERSYREIKMKLIDYEGKV